MILSNYKFYLVKWAQVIGSKSVDNKFKGESPPWFFTLANYLVFNKVKAAMGLSESKYFQFGAAPMKKSTLNFFKSLSIPVFNVYGMSESTGPQFMNMGETGVDLKSAGVNVTGTEFKIFNQDKDGQGEICFRGRNRFMGYYKNEEATLETIDQEGYIHSGDQGYINNKEVLIITGRFKEILKTAGGEMVAPVPIEENIHAESSIFSLPVVIGDDRKYLSVLLTLKTEPNGDLLPEVLKVFKEVNPEVKTAIQAMNDPQIKSYIQSIIDRVNLKAPSRAQLIKRWTILPHEFTVDGGEITPTLKLKRKFISQKYAKEIDMMYLEGKF